MRYLVTFTTPDADVAREAFGYLESLGDAVNCNNDTDFTVSLFDSLDSSQS